MKKIICLKTKRVNERKGKKKERNENWILKEKKIIRPINGKIVVIRKGKNIIRLRE